MGKRVPNSEKTQFKKNDPRINRDGRPKEHPLKGKVAFEIWDAIVKLSRMKKEAAEKLIKGNPTMVYVMAWKYITQTHTEAVDRLCGRIPNKSEVTGGDGDPLIPPPPPQKPIDFSPFSKEQLDKFIENLKP